MGPSGASWVNVQVWRALSMTAVQNGGQTPSAHGPKSRSPSTTAATPATGSSQKKVPAPPKCPNVSADGDGPAQWPRLPEVHSKVNPQSSGSKRPTFGSTPRSPGNWIDVISSTPVGDRTV